MINPHCPHCRCPITVECVDWEAQSLDHADRDNKAILTEYQCKGCDKSFWVGQGEVAP